MTEKIPDTTTPLPDFEAPPLDEVVLGVQFEPLRNLTVPHVGALWSRFSAEYPATENHEPIQPLMERFGTGGPGNTSFQIEMLRTAAPPRVWFLSGDGTEVIQIQEDRFLHNWRSRNESDAYPRYTKLRERFRDALITFSEYIQSAGIGVVAPIQCEATYINLIVIPGSSSTHRELGRITNLVSSPQGESLSITAESTTMETRYQFAAAPGRQPSRLYVSFQPVFRSYDRAPAYLMNLTVRGAPRSRDITGAMEFLDFAHNHIVRTFDIVATDEMHKLWKRKAGA